MPIIKELHQQIEDIQAGATRNIGTDYGHAINSIVLAGQNEAGETEEMQIRRMKDEAAEAVVRYGVKILDFLRPELRVLIEPYDIEELEKEHQRYLSS